MTSHKRILAVLALLVPFLGLTVTPASAEQAAFPATLLTSFDGSVPVIGGNYYTTPVISGDGRWVIYAEGYDDQRMLRRMDRTTGLATTIAGPAESFFPSVSGDGRWVVFIEYQEGGTNSHVRLWDANSRSASTISSSTAYAFGPIISDDGNRVVWTKGPTGVASSHEETVVWTRGGALRTRTPAMRPTLSGNGRYVFLDVGGSDSRRRWDLNTDSLLTVDGLYGSADYSDDGTRLAAASYPGAAQAILLKDIPTEQTTEISLQGSLTLNAPTPVISGNGSLSLFGTTVGLAPEDSGNGTYDNYLVRFEDNIPIHLPLPVVGTFVDVSDDGRYGLLLKTIDEERVELWIVDLATTLLSPPQPDARPGDDQILRLYQAALGRVPDGTGYLYWLNRYRSGDSLLSIAASFASSPEFHQRFGTQPTNLELVNGLYQNVLNRDGDQGGVNFWIAQLNAGLRLEELIVEFSDSSENISRTSTSPPISSSEASVLRLYRAVFGRNPDLYGYNYWINLRRSGAPLPSLAQAFSDSPEYASRYGTNPSDQALVEALYQNVLGRPGDQEGTDFWIGLLQGGSSAAEIIVAFSDSAENLQRTGTVR